MKKKYKLSKLPVLCLCVILLLLTACQGGAAGSSVPEGLSSESSSSQVETSRPQEEAAATAPETVPDDPTQLMVPLQMTEPGEDVYPSGEHSYSTQAEADACRQWLYDLKAEDITALYGNTGPMNRYWTGEMSMEDSRRIVDLLRSMAPGLAPLAEGNPATGGAWDIAVETGDQTVGLWHDGCAWFTFTREGKTWILDGSDQ